MEKRVTFRYLDFVANFNLMHMILVIHADYAKNKYDKI